MIFGIMTFAFGKCSAESESQASIWTGQGCCGPCQWWGLHRSGPRQEQPHWSGHCEVCCFQPWILYSSIRIWTGAVGSHYIWWEVTNPVLCKKSKYQQYHHLHHDGGVSQLGLLRSTNIQIHCVHLWDSTLGTRSLVWSDSDIPER